MGDETYDINNSNISVSTDGYYNHPNGTYTSLSRAAAQQEAMLQSVMASDSAEPISRGRVKLLIDPIENGHLVSVTTFDHADPKKFYIADLDDLPNMLAAQMAAIKIGV